MYFRNKVTVTNFILAILVMLLHSQNIEQYATVNQTMIPGLEYFISRTLGNLAVPCFFLISAYLFYRNYGQNKIIEKYKSRIRSVLIPYLLWNLLYYLAFLVLVAFPVSRNFMVTQQVELSVQELWSAVLDHKYNGVYWFMKQLIWFVALSPAIWLMMRKKAGIILPVLLILLNCSGIHLPFGGLGIRIDMLVYWCLGCYFALHGADAFENRGCKARICSCGVTFLLLLGIRFWLEFVHVENKYSEYLMPLLLLLNVLALWFVLDAFKYRKTYWWMEITFFIYSAHPMLVDAVKKGVAKLLPDTPALCLTNYFAAVGISLLVIIGVAGLLMKYAPHVWSVLNGGRKAVERG